MSTAATTWVPAWCERERTAMLLLFVIALLVHLPGVVTGDFHFDDIHHITENPAVRSLANIPQFFIDASLFSGEPGNAMYRPVLMCTYTVDYAIWGYRAVGWLFTNALVHAGVALLVCRVGRRLGLSPLAAFFAGACMAIHPVFSEVVVYAASRSESIAALLMLTALLVHLRATEDRARTRFGLIALAAGLAILATLSKETTAGFCAAVGLLELVRGYGAWGPRIRRAVLLSLPYTAALIVVMLLRGAMLESTVADLAIVSTKQGVDPQLGGGRSVVDNLITQSRVVVLYLQLLARPVRLSVDHDVSVVQQVTAAVAVAALVHLSIVACAVRAFLRGRRLLPLTVGWFWIFLAPSVVIPLNVVMNEHRLYLPGIAVSLLAGAALGRVAALSATWRVPRSAYIVGLAAPLALLPFVSWPVQEGAPIALVSVVSVLALTWVSRPLSVAGDRRRGVAIACAPLFLLVAPTVDRSLEWRDDLVLWSAAVRRAPDSARAQMHLGAALHNAAGRKADPFAQVTLLEEAIVRYALSEQLHPNWVDLHLNRSEALLSIGEITGEAERFEEALKSARKINEILGHEFDKPLMLQVRALTGLERCDEALAIVTRLDENDESVTPLYDLLRANVLRKGGDREEAEAALLRAIDVAEPMRRLDALCKLGWWRMEDSQLHAGDQQAIDRCFADAERYISQAADLAASPEGRGLQRRYLPYLYIARFLNVLGQPGAQTRAKNAMGLGWTGNAADRIWVRGGPTPGRPQWLLGTTLHGRYMRAVMPMEPPTGGDADRR